MLSSQCLGQGLLGTLLMLSTGSLVAGTPPLFSKQFLPDQIGPDNVARLVYTIDTSFGAANAENLSFEETLPAGMVVADPVDPANTCGGVLRARPGSDRIYLSGGRATVVDSGCLISINVTAGGDTTYMADSGDLTSSLGNSGPSSAMLTTMMDLPRLSASYSPMTVLAGDISTLTYAIDNTDGNANGFGLNLSPQAGTRVADIPNIVNSCGGAASVSPENQTVNVIGAALGAGGSCSVSFDVQSSLPGRYPLVTSIVIFGSDEIGYAQTELEVVSPTLAIDKTFASFPVGVPRSNAPAYPPPAPPPPLEPVLSMAFVEPVVGVNLPATLEITFDNSADPSNELVTSSFELSEGLTVAPSPNVTFTPGCTISLNPSPGSSTVFMNLSVIPGFAICNGTFDVVADRAGLFRATNLENGTGNWPDFTATAEMLAEYSVDATAAQQLVFDIANLDRNDPAVNVNFSDDLNAMVAGAAAIGLPQNNVCGAGSQLSGTSTITLTGGTIPAADRCQIIVDVDIPDATPNGAYTNNTSNIEGDVGPRFISDPGASLDFLVGPIATLSKTFLPDLTTPGSVVTVEYTLTNPSATETLTGSFQDVYVDLSGAANATLPANGFCGAGSSAFNLSASDTPRQAFFIGLELAPSGSCTFSIDVPIAIDARGGDYDLATSAFLGDLGGQAIGSAPASDVLTVLAGPRLRMTMASLLAAPGGTVDVSFVLGMADDDADGASNIAFTLDLDAALSGLTAIGLPVNDVCGAGSQLSGTNLLTFTGGSLPAAGQCEFTVTLQLPAAGNGNVTLTSSQITSEVLATPTLSPLTFVEFALTDLSVMLSIAPSIAGPGDVLTFTLTVVNNNATDDAVGISFNVDLTNFIPGATRDGAFVPDVCGAGSDMRGGPNDIELFNGSVAANSQCSWDVDVTIPGGANFGDYLARISSFFAVVGGQLITGLSDTAPVAVVRTEEALLNVSFTNPNAAGDMTQLFFDISTATGINNANFTALLDNALPGLAAVASFPADPCGAGSSLGGTGTLVLSNVTLPAAGSCQFSVDVDVPLTAAAGDYAVNVTSGGLFSDDTSALLQVRVETTLTVDNDMVTGDEGQVILNTGTFAQGSDGIVSFSASIGSVENLGNRVWRWSYLVNDGPDDTQTVTIFADTNRGGNVQTMVTFDLVAVNVVPGIVVDGLRSFTPNVPYTLSLLEIVDPGDDTVTNIEIDWGDGATTNVGGLGDVMHTYTTSNDEVTVRISLTDEDGVHPNVRVFRLFNDAEVVFYDGLEDELGLGGRDNLNPR